jgi:23S rRNA (cytidine1920-2'-O)/16S rRNA (cytidine1409-2'-O)-methyltransferase
MGGEGERLDQAMVARGLAPSRSRARALIEAGAVTVDGVRAGKAGLRVGEAARLVVAGDPVGYVSRAGLKLRHALDALALSPRGAVALDLGSSTGGFTEVLLEAGAAAVWAVDVGHGQMAPRIAADPRVRVIEGLNARAITAEHVPPLDWITADLSFIALSKALPPALGLAPAGAVLVALVKPQFEVGRAHVGKGGVVRDPAAVDRAVEGVRAFLRGQGWSVIGETESPILGGDGNREILVAARKR